MQRNAATASTLPQQPSAGSNNCVDPVHLIGATSCTESDGPSSSSVYHSADESNFTLDTTAAETTKWALADGVEDNGDGHVTQSSRTKLRLPASPSIRTVAVRQQLLARQSSSEAEADEESWSNVDGFVTDADAEDDSEMSNKIHTKPESADSAVRNRLSNIPTIVARSRHDVTSSSHNRSKSGEMRGSTPTDRNNSGWHVTEKRNGRTKANYSGQVNAVEDHNKNKLLASSNSLCRLPVSHRLSNVVAADLVVKSNGSKYDDSLVKSRRAVNEKKKTTTTIITTTSNGIKNGVIKADVEQNSRQSSIPQTAGVCRNGVWPVNGRFPGRAKRMNPQKEQHAGKDSDATASYEQSRDYRKSVQTIDPASVTIKLSAARNPRSHSTEDARHRQQQLVCRSRQGSSLPRMSSGNCASGHASALPSNHHHQHQRRPRSPCRRSCRCHNGHDNDISTENCSNTCSTRRSASSEPTSEATAVVAMKPWAKTLRDYGGDGDKSPSPVRSRKSTPDTVPVSRRRYPTPGPGATTCSSSGLDSASSAELLNSVISSPKVAAKTRLHRTKTVSSAADASTKPSTAASNNAGGDSNLGTTRSDTTLETARRSRALGGFRSSDMTRSTALRGGGNGIIPPSSSLGTMQGRRAVNTSYAASSTTSYWVNSGSVQPGRVTTTTEIIEQASTTTSRHKVALSSSSSLASRPPWMSPSAIVRSKRTTTANSSSRLTAKADDQVDDDPARNSTEASSRTQPNDAVNDRYAKQSTAVDRSLPGIKNRKQYGGSTEVPYRGYALASRIVEPSKATNAASVGKVTLTSVNRVQVAAAGKGQLKSSTKQRNIAQQQQQQQQEQRPLSQPEVNNNALDRHLVPDASSTAAAAAAAISSCPTTFNLGSSDKFSKLGQRRNCGGGDLSEQDLNRRRRQLQTNTTTTSSSNAFRRHTVETGPGGCVEAECKQLPVADDRFSAERRQTDGKILEKSELVDARLPVAAENNGIELFHERQAGGSLDDKVPVSVNAVTGELSKAPSIDDNVNRESFDSDCIHTKCDETVGSKQVVSKSGDSSCTISDHESHHNLLTDAPQVASAASESSNTGTLGVSGNNRADTSFSTFDDYLYSENNLKPDSHIVSSQFSSSSVLDSANVTAAAEAAAIAAAAADGGASRDNCPSDKASEPGKRELVGEKLSSLSCKITHSHAEDSSELLFTRNTNSKSSIDNSCDRYTSSYNTEKGAMIKGGVHNSRQDGALLTSGLFDDVTQLNSAIETFEQEIEEELMFIDETDPVIPYLRLESVEFQQPYDDSNKTEVQCLVSLVNSIVGSTVQNLDAVDISQVTVNLRPEMTVHKTTINNHVTLIDQSESPAVMPPTSAKLDNLESFPQAKPCNLVRVADDVTIVSTTTTAAAAAENDRVPRGKRFLQQNSVFLTCQQQGSGILSVKSQEVNSSSELQKISLSLVHANQKLIEQPCSNKNLTGCSHTTSGGIRGNKEEVETKHRQFEDNDDDDDMTASDVRTETISSQMDNTSQLSSNFSSQLSFNSVSGTNLEPLTPVTDDVMATASKSFQRTEDTGSVCIQPLPVPHSKSEKFSSPIGAQEHHHREDENLPPQKMRDWFSNTLPRGYRRSKSASGSLVGRPYSETQDGGDCGRYYSPFHRKSQATTGYGKRWSPDLSCLRPVQSPVDPDDVTAMFNEIGSNQPASYRLFHRFSLFSSIGRRAADGTLLTRSRDRKKSTESVGNTDDDEGGTLRRKNSDILGKEERPVALRHYRSLSRHRMVDDDQEAGLNCCPPTPPLAVFLSTEDISGTVFPLRHASSEPFHRQPVETNKPTTKVTGRGIAASMMSSEIGTKAVTSSTAETATRAGGCRPRPRSECYIGVKLASKVLCTLQAASWTDGNQNKVTPGTSSELFSDDCSNLSTASTPSFRRKLQRAISQPRLIQTRSKPMTSQSNMATSGRTKFGSVFNGRCKDSVSAPDLTVVEVIKENSRQSRTTRQHDSAYRCDEPFPGRQAVIAAARESKTRPLSDYGGVHYANVTWSEDDLERRSLDAGSLRSSEGSRLSCTMTIDSRQMSWAFDEIARFGQDDITRPPLFRAQAQWDHVTIETDELGFRAGDDIDVISMVDRDWWWGRTEEAQGWFPAAFVKLQPFNDYSNKSSVEKDIPGFRLAENSGDVAVSGSLFSGVTSLQDSMVNARCCVIREIVKAEQDYVRHLYDVIKGYLEKTRSRPEMFDSEKIATIFGNIEEVYQFAKCFLEDLEKHVQHRQPEMSKLGSCFLRHKRGFEIYSDYCNNHSFAVEELSQLHRDPVYQRFFEMCRLQQRMIAIPLEGFLLTPVQKICKYPLQLRELLCCTWLSHPDYRPLEAALDAMREIASLVNERKRKMESSEKLAEWQKTVLQWQGPALTDTSSEMIHFGELTKISMHGWHRDRIFYLFDHQMIYLKKDLLWRNLLIYRGRINMDNCIVHDCRDGRDSMFGVSVKNAFKLYDRVDDKWYLLVCRNNLDKTRWLTALENERELVAQDRMNGFTIESLKRRQSVAQKRSSRAPSAGSVGRRGGGAGFDGRQLSGRFIRAFSSDRYKGKSHQRQTSVPETSDNK